MVADWAQARQENPEERTVMLTDASNTELEKINALAQERRAQAGELGEERVELPDRPYGLAAGDQVIFTGAFYQPGEPRVENGTLGTVTSTGRENGTLGRDRSSVEESSAADRNSGEENHLTIKTQGAHEREVEVNTSEFKDLRLSYAQHVYKAQGLTVNHAFVLTGGWQTDRERAYVAVSRAQERTDIYVSHEDLGEQGMDTGAIERLAEAMSESHAQQPSITTPLAERDPAQERGEQTQERESESEVGRIMRESQEQQDRDREQDRDLGHGIE
jgi:ATP-dependent exoDNAse (exonuclease V) alpha subunit